MATVGVDDQDLWETGLVLLQLKVERLRARNLGHYILVDVWVSVIGDISVQEGHAFTREVKTTIIEAYPQVREVLVQLNPYYGEG